MREPDSQLDRLATAVIGAAISVHQELGPGFLEKIYEAALCHELTRLGIRYERQKRVEVRFKDVVVGEAIFDLLVEGRLIVELKASDSIHPVHVAQTISYLKTIKEPLGLLLNFQVARMKDGIKQVVWTK